MQASPSRAELATPVGTLQITAPAAVLDDLAELFPGLEVAAGRRGEAIASLRIAAEGGGLGLALDGRPMAVATGWRRLRVAFVHQLEGLLLARRGGRLALHAGAVTFGEEAWLVAGRSGSGKTTTSFHLLELGAALVSEEVSLVDGEGSVAVFPRALELDRQLVDAWRRRGPLVGGELVENDRGGAPRYLAHRLARHDPRVCGLLLPRYAPKAPAEIEEIDAGAAITDLLGHFFEPSEPAEAFYDAAIALAESVRIVAITYPNGVAARRLLRGLAGSTG